MTGLLAQLKGVARSGDGWTARCPAHDDRHNSLSIHHRDGHWLLKCHAGCGWQEIVDALRIDGNRPDPRAGGDQRRLGHGVAGILDPDLVARRQQHAECDVDRLLRAACR